MESALDQNQKNKQFLKAGYWFNILFPWIVFIIAMLVLFLGWQLIVKKQYERLDSNLSSVKSMDVQISSLNSIIKSTGGEFDNSLKFDKVEESLLNKAMPESPDFPSILIQLDGLARKNGFLAQNIKVNSPIAAINDDKSEGKIKKVDLSLNVIGGSYDDFKGLLLSLEKSIMPFDVVSVAFGNKQNGIQGYNLNLVSYYYPKNTN
jgi:Tfp pilus assembly protein PilO